MKQQRAAAILMALTLTFFSSLASALAADNAKEDTDTKLVAAKVVEVTDARISVIARTGVEHVIAVDRANTKVTVNGRAVSLKDVHEGEVITIELDARNPVKFAKNISVQPSNDQVASIVR